MSSTTRYFQWIRGERRDQICLFDHIESDEGIIYIAFTDKSRIDENLVAQLNQRDLTGKYVAEIDHPTNRWIFKERKTKEEERIEQDAESGVRYEVPSANDIAHADLSASGGTTRPEENKRKIIDLVPPKPTPPSHSVFGLIKNTNVISQSTSDSNISKIPEKMSKNVDANDPVYILMNASKKNDTEVSMNITISLPPQNLYNIAKESFNLGNEKFVEYIIQDITVDKIKDALKIAITEMYEQNKTS
jgi:hypothetical protein